MPHSGHTGIIEENPDRRTIHFANRYVNLSALARETGFNRSYLSYVFRGKKSPSVPTLQKLSLALAMTMDDFMIALAQRTRKDIITICKRAEPTSPKQPEVEKAQPDSYTYSISNLPDLSC